MSEINNRVQGRIVHIVQHKRFGFIDPGTGNRSDNIFFLFGNVTGNYVPVLGDIVQFEIQNNSASGKSRATNITFTSAPLITSATLSNYTSSASTASSTSLITSNNNNEQEQEEGQEEEKSNTMYIQGTRPHFISAHCVYKSLRNVQSSYYAINILTYCEKYICAFLNMSGGSIYFGTQEDGQIIGIQLNRTTRNEIRTAIHALTHRFYPSVSSENYTIEFVPVTASSVEYKKSILEDVYVVVVTVNISADIAPLYETTKKQAWGIKDGTVVMFSPGEIAQRIANQNHEKHDKVKDTLAQNKDPLDRSCNANAPSKINRLTKYDEMIGDLVLMGYDEEAIVYVIYKLIKSNPDRNILIDDVIEQLDAKN
jgi:hypothetical protein